jgi:hypothetical protein
LLCLVLRFLYPKIISRNLAFRVARGPEATPEAAPLPKSPVHHHNYPTTGPTADGGGEASVFLGPSIDESNAGCILSKNETR